MQDVPATVTRLQNVEVALVDCSPMQDVSATATRLRIAQVVLVGLERSGVIVPPTAIWMTVSYPNCFCCWNYQVLVLVLGLPDVPQRIAGLIFLRLVVFVEVVIAPVTVNWIQNNPNHSCH